MDTTTAIAQLADYFSGREIFTLAWNNIATATPTLVGFVSAWILFELQEFRKQGFAGDAARQSLIEELKFLEVQLSLSVIKCANQSGIIDKGVKEFRWTFKEGFARSRTQGFTPEELSVLQIQAGHSDEQIATILRTGILRHEALAIELPISIITAVSTAPTSAKLSSIEIKRLLDVNWQMRMLTAEAHLMNEAFRLTFTVSDENQAIVRANHASSLKMYGRRAGYALDFVRAALSEIQTPTRRPSALFKSWRRSSGGV